MRLIQARVRCVEGVQDTGWFVPGRETTVIVGLPNSGTTYLLQALQTLNPLYAINREQPLAGHPQIWHQGNYARKVFPEKKTAVFMVFSAEPQQVLELEKIDPDLIETDRIEVGRRLDYSRWTTFVEISASTRWSEIAEEMHQLYTELAAQPNLPEAARQDSFFLQLQGSLKGADRVKGEVADACLRWLEAIAPCIPTESRGAYGRCLHGVTRAERFRRANRQVAAWLPLTLYLHPGYEVHSSYSFTDIFNTHQPLQPVLSLLRLLCERFGLPEAAAGGGAAALTAALGRIAPLNALLQGTGLVLPSIRYDSKQIIVEGIAPQTVLEHRFYLITVTCLLAELCHGQRPLLLLDQFDRGLSPVETLKMVNWLQRLGRLCQLLAATEQEAVAAADGWQAVQRVGPGGLATAKLESAKP